MSLPNEVIGTIVGGIVAIAGLIFRAKGKAKTTRRKSKTVETYDQEVINTTVNRKKKEVV